MLTYLIIALPILFQIASPLSVISLGELLILPVLIMTLMAAGPGRIKLEANITLFYAIPIALTLLVAMLPSDYFDIGAFLTVFARMIFYYALILAARVSFDIEKGMRFYFALASVACVYLAAQCAFHYAFVSELPIPRSFSEFLFSYSDSMSATSYYSLFGFRPAAFFTEPSYLTFFLTPLIAILLFSEKASSGLPCFAARHRFAFAFAFTAAEMLSTSSTSIATSIIIWLVFLFTQVGASKTARARGVTTKIFLIVLFVGVGGVLYASGLMDVLITRSVEGASLGPRVLRGFIIFSEMSPLEQAIGVGVNNIGPYVTSHGIWTVYDEESLNYATDFANRLVTTGIIGAVTGIACIVSLHYSSTNSAQKVIALLLAFYFLFNAGQYTFQFAFLVVIFYSLGDVSHNVSEEKGFVST